MRERILAVVGAIGLIVGAVFLRSALSGDGSGDGGSGGAGNSAGSRPVVACTADLSSVCDALVSDGSITSAPSALDLSGAAADVLQVDGWITWDPAPGVANYDRQDTWFGMEAIASAPLGVLVSGGPGGCGRSTSWHDCVVDGVDQGLTVGVGDGTTAQSLARLHPIAATLVPADGNFTEIPRSSLRNVIDSPQVSQADYARQINTFLTQRGALDLVVGPVPALEAAAARQASATVTTPEPAARLTVVIASRRTSSGGGGSADPISADHLLRSRTAATALEELGLVPGTGTASDAARAGEVWSIRDKVR